MKDKLGRQIVTGDVLASVEYDYSTPMRSHSGLVLWRVLAVAPFALQGRPLGSEEDAAGTRVFIDASEMALVR